MTTLSFRIPSPEEITQPKRRMTERRREKIMDEIIRECFGNLDVRVAFEIAKRLEYPVTGSGGIGSEYFLNRLNEAREGATVTVLTPYPEWS